MTLSADQIGYMTDRFGAAVSMCGSRITCDPPPTDTDEDWLVFVRGDKDLSHLVDFLHSQEWEWEGSEHYQSVAGNFMSWRKGDANLIVTKNEGFWKLHRIATEVCKHHNVMEKTRRIRIFQAILYGNFGDDNALELVIDNG